MSERKKLTLEEWEEKAANVYNSIIDQWDQIIRDFPHGTLHWTAFGIFPSEFISIEEIENSSIDRYNEYFLQIEKERKNTRFEKQFLQKKYIKKFEFFIWGIEHDDSFEADYFEKDCPNLYLDTPLKLPKEIFKAKNFNGKLFSWPRFYNSFYKNEFQELRTYQYDFKLVPNIVAEARLCRYLKKEILLLTDSKEVFSFKNKLLDNLEVKQDSRHLNSINFKPSFTLQNENNKPNLRDLYINLCRHGFISKDNNPFPEFQQIFSGKEIINKIKWNSKNVQPLAFFIKQLRDKNIIHVEEYHWQTTLNCFESTNKYGKPLKVENLKHPGSRSIAKELKINEALKPLE